MTKKKKQEECLKEVKKKTAWLEKRKIKTQARSVGSRAARSVRKARRRLSEDEEEDKKGAGLPSYRGPAW